MPESLDEQYRKLYPKGFTEISTPDLDTEYNKLYGEKEEDLTPTQRALLKFARTGPPPLSKDIKLEQSTRDPIELVTRKKEPFIKTAAKKILPSGAEKLFGLDKPEPIKTERERFLDIEKSRQAFAREQEFREVFNREVREDIKLPKDYKEPEGFFGQLVEGVEAGWKSTVVPSVGYFTEAMGRKIGSRNMIEWGQEFGDRQMINFIKQPELVRPEDLKGVTEGGLLDPRLYGRTIGEVLPFMATILGISTAGFLTGGPAGAFGGAFTSSAILNQGNAYKRMIDEGVSPLDAGEASFVYGLVAAGIEICLVLCQQRWFKEWLTLLGLLLIVIKTF